MKADTFKRIITITGLIMLSVVCNASDQPPSKNDPDKDVKTSFVTFSKKYLGNLAAVWKESCTKQNAKNKERAKPDEIIADSVHIEIRRTDSNPNSYVGIISLRRKSPHFNVTLSQTIGFQLKDNKWTPTVFACGDDEAVEISKDSDCYRAWQKTAQ